MNRKNVALLTAGIVLALAGTAQAATRTASFQVSANVIDNCIISATALNLGTFDGTNNLAASAPITVRCSNGTDYTVDLSTGSSGTYAARTLVNGSYSLAYNLYTSNTYTSVWGDTTSGTSRISGFGAGMAVGNAITHNVYGQLLAANNSGPIDAGSYVDNITATVTY